MATLRCLRGIMLQPRSNAKRMSLPGDPIGQPSGGGFAGPIAPVVLQARHHQNLPYSHTYVSHNSPSSAGLVIGFVARHQRAGRYDSNHTAFIRIAIDMPSMLPLSLALTKTTSYVELL
jgi:hypothetical protein